MVSKACVVSKGEQTRDAILDKALGLASRVGLGGLTIGTLSEELGLSKSGLFAHFGSKEALMLRTLEYAAERFAEVVIGPAVAAPRGEARIRSLFDAFRRWPVLVPQPGGCIFVAAGMEFDDRPGPIRDRLRALRQEWHDFVAGAARRAMDAGDFRLDLDPDQFAFELDGIQLAWHQASRLRGDPKAEERARTAFEALVGAARAPATGRAAVKRRG
jgi:AcrR family transcriptional regulator